MTKLARVLPAAVAALTITAAAAPFAAADSRPLAQTTPATGVTDTAATLTGVIGGRHGAGLYQFQWGTTGYDHLTAVRVAGASETDTVVSAAVTGLTPGTRYRFRLVAQSWGAGGIGGDQSFTTDPGVDAEPAAVPPPAPAATTAPAPPSAPDAAPAPDPAPADIAADAPVAPAAPLPVAEPAIGETMVVAPVAGTVKVRVPGSAEYAPLAAGGSVPVGAVVDARAGTVQLTSALGGGRTQAGSFHGAVFEVRQSASGHGMTDLYLRGPSLGPCATRRTGGAAVGRAAAVSKRRPHVRRLWGRDSGGRFRTHGRDSVATVRGTRWVTTESCAGTRTTVTEGAVAVRDLHRKRTVLVRAGHSYLARRR